MNVIVTFFRDVLGNSKEEQPIGLGDLADLMQATFKPSKAALPLLKFARFGDQRTDKGSLRHDANVVAVTGVEADYDDEQADLRDAIDILTAAGIEALVYTSPSHTPERPRWRIFCPLSHEAPPSEREGLMGRLAGLFASYDVSFARESWTLSQAYYYGSVSPNGSANPTYQAVIVEGTPLDQRDDLDAGAMPPPKSRGNGRDTGNGREQPRSRGNAGDDKLWRLIREGESGEYGGDRSAAEFYVITEMLRRGYRPERIVVELTDRTNGISEKAYEQTDPRGYTERQVERGIEKLDFARNDKGKPYGTQDNIRIALLMLDIQVQHDLFAGRDLIAGLEDFGPALDDATLTRLWLTLDKRFDLRVPKAVLRDVLADTARLNGFHPVKDYLESVRWDAKPRLDTWLIDYAGAEDSAYTRAVGALMLVAAVRRVRQPGCKFDEMVVFEQQTQGTDKSSALAILAVNEEWFSDDLPLNADTQKVIERMRGRWIMEAAELSGMRRADVEHLKSFLSRQIDRARMAYGHFVVEAPRQCIVVGTTNKGQYLRDTTGNRRFWPVSVAKFDLAALKRDRDQLWAEAAQREGEGESIRLARGLWPAAAKEQRQRLADDPFCAVLAQHLGNKEGKIRATDVWTLLDLRGAQLTQDVYMRAAEAMKRLGWERPNKAGTLRFDGGAPEVAYVRGDRPHRWWRVSRERGEVTIWEEGGKRRLDDEDEPFQPFP